MAGLVVATAGGLELEDLPAIPNISLSTAVVAGLVVATAGGLELEDLPAIPNIYLINSSGGWSCCCYSWWIGAGGSARYSELGTRSCRPFA